MPRYAFREPIFTQQFLNRLHTRFITIGSTILAGDIEFQTRYNVCNINSLKFATRYEKNGNRYLKQSFRKLLFCSI